MLPNNIALVAERLAGLRKKALEHSYICDFLVDSVSELKFNGYIELVQDLDGSSCPG